MEIEIYTKRSDSKFFIPFLKTLKLLTNSKIFLYDDIPSLNISDKKIYIFVRDLPIQYINIKNVLLYNTEQCSVHGNLIEMLNIIRKNIIIDYSEENISILKNHADLKDEDYIFLPIVYNTDILYPTSEKLYDFVFIGHNDTKRRMDILSELQRSYNVLILHNKWDNDNMLIPYILQAKILINIHHADDNKITEVSRCYIPVYNRMLVISEESINMEITNNCYINRFIIFEKYENLINKCNEVINDYNYHYNLVFKDFDQNIVYEYTNKLFNNFYNRISNIIH